MMFSPRPLLSLFGWLPLLALLALSGCQSVSVRGVPEVDWEALAAVAHPRTLAVLPTTEEDDRPDLTGPMRLALYGSLAPLEFKDRELSDVDQRLALIANRMGLRPEELPPEARAHPLLGDTVAFSHIESVSRFYLIFYAHNRLRLNLQLVDTHTRKVFYRGRFTITNRRLEATIDPFGLAGTAVSSLWHLRADQLAQTLETGADKIAAQIPPLPATVATDPGELCIERLAVKLPRTLLRAGDKIEVEVLGTPKGQATFRFGPGERPRPLIEVAPGRYLGRAEIEPGMDTPYAFIEAELGLGEPGETVRDSAIDQPFAIDTMPPPRGRVARCWPAPPRRGIYLELETDPTDPRAQLEAPQTYFIYRRPAGGGRFQRIGESAATTFLDAEADPGHPWEYQIITRDPAGNDAAPGPIARRDPAVAAR